MAAERHRRLEQRWLSFTVLTLLAVLVGGGVLLVPPFFLQGTIEPIPGELPYTALEQEGRDLYMREGCYVCHSQQVRPLRTETDATARSRWPARASTIDPFQLGSRRTGPDLARVGEKYPDSWHWLHFRDPRSIEPRSNMPSFAFLTQQPLDLSLTRRKLEVLRTPRHALHRRGDRERRGRRPARSWRPWRRRCARTASSSARSGRAARRSR